MRLKNSSIQVRIFEFREEPTSAIHLKWYRLWFALLTLLSTAGTLSIAIIRGTIDNWLDSPAIVTELLVAAFAANLFFATEFISKTKMTDFGLSLNAPFIACLAARKMHRLENDFKAHGSEKQAARAQSLIGIRRSLTTEARVRAYSDLFWMVGMTAVLATLQSC